MSFIFFFFFLQGDPGDPLPMRFSRIWRNSERESRSEGSRRERESDGAGGRRGDDCAPFLPSMWRLGRSSRATLKNLLCFPFTNTESSKHRNHHLTSQLKASKLIFIPNIWKIKVLLRILRLTAWFVFLCKTYVGDLKQTGSGMWFSLNFSGIRLWLMSARSIMSFLTNMTKLLNDWI